MPEPGARLVPAQIGGLDPNHLRQILDNVRAYVWPFMGNAQRFTRP